MEPSLSLVGWINNDLQGRLPEKIYLLTVFYSQSCLDYPLTFTGFPLVSKSLCLQIICKCQCSQHCSSAATPKNSERFEISCPRSELSKSLNSGIISAFIYRLYSCLLFVVLGVFSPCFCFNKVPSCPVTNLACTQWVHKRSEFLTS